MFVCLSVCRVLHHIVIAATRDHTVVEMALGIKVVFEDIVSFVIPLAAMLTSSPVMWRK
jgi:hypothetical protein